MPFFKTKRAPKMKEEAEISSLSHQYAITASRPRGICLLINNVPKFLAGEEKLKNLFQLLSFQVEINRNLTREAFYALATKIAKRNHDDFDIFVAIFLSCNEKCNGISCAHGKKASLEQFIEEFTASRCPSLQHKPKLFFVQHFSRPKCRRSVVPKRNFADKDTVSFPCNPTSEIDSCPEEADFLLVCVKSTYLADQSNRVTESLFIQILDRVIRDSYQLHHLLDMLTMVNEQMKDKQSDLPNISVPHRYQTLGKRVYLSLTPPSAPITPDVAQEDCYEMKKNPRGLCLILNNDKFQDKTLNRPGAVKDVSDLKLLFKELFFKVIIKKNLTKDQLEKLAKGYGAKDHKAYNAFVFIVMSHGGDRDCILGVKGREATVKCLISEFREKRCPSLKHKPKVFIIQACRGPREDTDYTISSSDAAKTVEAQISSQPCDTAFSTDSTLPRSVFPPEDDFVLAFATAPCYAAYRDSDKGSRFIQVLVEVIREYHHHHHFLEILTEVTRVVVERFNSVQVPAPIDTLTKFLYL